MTKSSLLTHSRCEDFIVDEAEVVELHRHAARPPARQQPKVQRGEGALVPRHLRRGVAGVAAGQAMVGVHANGLHPLIHSQGSAGAR